MLTSIEIHALLKVLREKYGPGYADADHGIGVDGATVSVASLQAKLSVMLEAAQRSGR
jgi:hypothetical protein